MVIDLKMYSSSRSIKKNQALLDDIDYNWLTSTSNKGTGLCLAALGCSGRERERKGEKERERERKGEKGKEHSQRWRSGPGSLRPAPSRTEQNKKTIRPTC